MKLAIDHGTLALVRLSSNCDIACDVGQTSEFVQPPVGAQFNILGGLRFGEFATVEGDLLPNGSWYAPIYNPANVLLIVRRGLSLRR